MSKILMREAEALVPVKRAALYWHAKEGKISTSKNAQGKTVVDVAELQRFYGNINQNGNGAHTETDETTEREQNGQPETAKIEVNGQHETQPQTQEVIELLKSQLSDMKTELADAKDRETRLLSLLENEQEKTRLLMLPPPDEKKKKSSWLGYFRLRR